jgi:hypothetical protein
MSITPKPLKFEWVAPTPLQVPDAGKNSYVCIVNWVTSSNPYVLRNPGANPTKIYSATNSMTRFYNKNDFSLT